MPIVLDGTTGITSPAETIQGDLTTTGNTILGNASTDTLNVGNGGLVKDASGNVGVGVTPSAWDSSFKAIQMPNGASFAGYSGVNDVSVFVLSNANYSSGVYKYVVNDFASLYQQYNGAHQWHTAPSGTAGNTISFTQAMTLDASGNLQFNSGYGSVATAYGCRAWVNFNGTGTVAIRASGNVSSITDNGVGNYTVNFTTAMPDANYATTVNTQGATTGSIVGEWGLYTASTTTFATPTISAFQLTTWNSAVSGLADTAYVMASVFR